MKKNDVILEVSRKTAMSVDVCTAAMEAVESLTGSAVMARFKGGKLNESPEAVQKVAAATGLNDADAATLLAAFEEVLGDELGRKFPFLRKKQ